MVQKVIGDNLAWLLGIPKTYDGLLQLLRSNVINDFWKEELVTLRLKVDSKQAVDIEADLTYIITMIMLNNKKSIY